MHAYLVRTKIDRTLVGLFCARSVADLARLIDTVFDARECEYLELRANDGLFIEAQFLNVPGPTPDAPEQEVLVHPDDPLLEAQAPEESAGSIARDIAAVIERQATRLHAHEDAADAGAPAGDGAEERDIVGEIIAGMHEEEEYIPPVLAPTEQLHRRLQSASRQQKWRPLLPGPRRTPRGRKLNRTEDAALPSPHSASAGSEVVIRKLMQGALNPASFIQNASRRYH